MKYRVIIRPEWTFSNNSPTHKYKVQRKILNLFWWSTGDKWHSRKDAEQYIKDVRTIL